MFELLFATKRNQARALAVAEPVDEIAARKSFLLDEIKRLDLELADHDAAERNFKVKHTAIIDGRMAIVYARGANIGNARMEVESGWKRLCEQREAIQKKRNEVLQELGKYS